MLSKIDTFNKYFGTAVVVLMIYKIMNFILANQTAYEVIDKTKELI